MKVRFGDAIGLNVELSNTDRSRCLLPLTLQTLVENAVKHNALSEKEPLIVSIKSEGGKALIVCNVINPKSFITSNSGTGLKNLSERYAFYSGKEVVYEKSGNEFRVRVPLLKQNQQ